MDRFVIALLDSQPENVDNVRSVGELYKCETEEKQILSPRPVTYIRVISNDGNSILKQPNYEENNIYPDWVNLSLLPDQRLLLHSQGEEKSDGEFCLSEEIHSAADSLPVQGCWVEVFVCLGTPWLQTLDEDSLVSLYAALKRLRTWHNTVIRFVTEDESNPLLQWRNYLHAEVIFSVSEATRPERTPLWKGQMLVLDSRDNVLFGFRDMSLEWGRGDSREVTGDLSTGNVEGINVENFSAGLEWEYLRNRLKPGLSLSPVCEILEEVDVITIPAFLLSPCRLQLKQTDLKDSAFIKHVNSCREVGYVLRLAYHRQEDVVTCGDGQPNTKNWKETVSANIASLYDIMENKEDITGYIHLLLAASDSHKIPTQDNSASCCCTAYILRSPTEINGGLVDFLHKQWLTKCGSPSESGDRLKTLVRELPVWNVALVEQLEAVIVKTQREVLQAWLEERRSRGESVCMTEAELVSILRDVHSHVLEIAKDQCDPAVALANRPYILQDFHQITSAEKKDWPEREALKLAENKSRKLARFMSSESLQQSSPIQPAEGTGGDKSVDVCDFLKLFKPDGSAVGNSLTVIQAKEGSLMLKKMSSFDDRETKWPQSKDVKFHDIYYNIGRKGERLEAEYRKLQQRHVLSETRCTISASSSGVLDHSCGKVKPRAVKKVTRSPVRRSPRKHAPSGNRLIGMTDTSRMSGSDVSVKKRKTEPLSQLPTEQPIRSLSAKSSSRATASRSAKEDVPPPKSAPVKNDKKASRSDRHKRRLQQIVQEVLLKKGVNSDNDLFKACSSKLFTVTKIYAMELPTSRNLVAEMTKIAEGQVQQVIDLEMMKRKNSGAK